MLRGKEHGIEKQVALVNELLTQLREKATGAGVDEAELLVPAELLLAVHDPPAPPPRPSLPLSTSTLLTHAKDEPRLGAELAAEIGSADAVDMLVSFIKWHGWRRLKEPFERFANAGRRLRVLTTTYMGATDREALDAIARLPGAEVRVSFDVRRTRLHAKAWLFQRATGFSSVYVGSANVSSAALSDGLEWNLKASEADAGHIVRKFRGAFDSLWEDGEFERYHPDDEGAVARLTASLAEERGGSPRPAGRFFDLRPYDFQRAILDRLSVEREEHGRHRNLVVAATGTGKTMVAAFDYARQVTGGVRPRLLFVAHRKELLEQARFTFRNVLRDESFGELLADGARPGSFDHIFATIQSLDGRSDLAALDPAFWRFVVVDEFHHAAAPSYRSLLDRLRPGILLGLTATPERTDGLDILGWFDHRIAADIRLWHALEKQLLTPFEYYGIADGVSLEQVKWRRGGYDTAELDNLYTGNDRRAALVVARLRELVGTAAQVKGLGFCVSVEHADYMARVFNAAGIRALAVHGSTPAEVRQSAPKRLQAGEVAFLFTCDLYNEGVDLPFVDTLLLLRPTESATLFLQQLGRGLRLHPGKTSTLVLDFIGQARAEYRFDAKLTALTGLPRGALGQAVEEGFPTLPSGCHMQLERVAREQILENLKGAIQGGTRRLAVELRALARERGLAVTLGAFLEATGRDLEDVYRPSVGGWTALRRAAGLLDGAGSPAEVEAGKRLRNLAHVDEPARLALYRRLARGELAATETLDERDRRRLVMLWLRVLAPPRRGKSSPTMATTSATLASLLGPVSSNPALCEELGQLCDLLDDRIAVSGRPVDVPADWPIAAHRAYARDEVFAGVGKSTTEKQVFSMEGTHRLPEEKVELLFVTLRKSAKHFSPTTSYEDYAISSTLFHWQTQSTASEASPTGQRYIHGHGEGWRFHLYVRPTVDDQFTFLGPVRYRSHQGSRPMNIVWELDVPIPPGLLQVYATLRAA
jgi:superfamily II DNA or RNA helicase/HKD family nuclease